MCKDWALPQENTFCGMVVIFPHKIISQTNSVNKDTKQVLQDKLVVNWDFFKFLFVCLFVLNNLDNSVYAFCKDTSAVEHMILSYSSAV